MDILNNVFCVNCHYHRDAKKHLCAVGKTTRLDLVTGEYHEESLVSCKVQREGHAGCGMEGRLFKPRLKEKQGI